jgi:endoglucanase
MVKRGGGRGKGGVVSGLQAVVSQTILVGVSVLTSSLAIGGYAHADATVREAQSASLTSSRATRAQAEASNGKCRKRAMRKCNRRNPFAGARWYIDPSSNARRQANAWRSSRPADAAQMDKVAAQPQADWFGEWSGDVRSSVSGRVATIRAARALPVLVAYNIPLRDCGGYSGGGASSPDAYRSWIRSFADGLGSGRAAVVLEPDALAAMDCLSPSDRQTRLDLLRDAVAVLASHRGTSVYLDAGHSHWHSPAEIAARLRSAGIKSARGFSLNVSNSHPTDEQRRYGDAISARTGGKRFLIDTSRNGQGSNGEWCNPEGRGLGKRPTAKTGDPRADAYFWIKRPGESDGTCNGGPIAGQWWAEYALGLAQRAPY